MSNKVRALITMLGVIIGVAAVVTLLSLGTGVQNFITGQLQAIGTNVLFVFQRGKGDHHPQPLTLADADAIATLKPPLVAVAPVFGEVATLVFTSVNANANVLGVTPEFRQVSSLSMADGVFIDEDQVRGATPVIVLGNSLATSLFGDAHAALGQTVHIGNSGLKVIGVLAPQGSFFEQVDKSAFVPISTAQRRLFPARTPDGNSYQVGSIRVSVHDQSDIQLAEDRIQALIRERHHQNPDGSTDDIGIASQDAILGTFNQVLTAITAFLAAVAGIALLVGGIGIMNIMLVSVTERTREIGLRKAIGARPRDILVQFVVEAITLSLGGGMIGLLVGGIGPMVITLTGLFSAPVQPSAVILSLSFSIAVGLFFGIYPAYRAARLNPIDALRYE